MNYNIICDLQLEFRKITPFGHALPPHGHSGRFRDQLDNEIPRKEIISTDGRRDGRTDVAYDNNR